MGGEWNAVEELEHKFSQLISLLIGYLDKVLFALVDRNM